MMLHTDENAPVQKMATLNMGVKPRSSWLGGNRGSADPWLATARPLEPSICSRSRDHSICSNVSDSVNSESQISAASLADEEDHFPRLPSASGLVAIVSGVVDLGSHREYVIVTDEWRRVSDGVAETMSARSVGRVRRRYSEFRLLSQLVANLGVPFQVRRHIINDTEWIRRARVNKLGEYLNTLLRAAGDSPPPDLLAFLGIDQKAAQMKAAAEAKAAAEVKAAAETKAAAEAVVVAAEFTTSVINVSLRTFEAETIANAAAAAEEALREAEAAAGEKALTQATTAVQPFPDAFGQLLTAVLRAFGCAPPEM
jgi:hypothetical protein